MAELKVLATTDPEFPQAIALRREVLLATVGLDAEDERDADPRMRHVAAFEGDRVVGFVSMCATFGSAQMRNLCVDSDHRGKGVATDLIKSLADIARREGIRTLWVNARFTATGFYTRLGFEPKGELIAEENSSVPHRRMELTL